MQNVSAVRLLPAFPHGPVLVDPPGDVRGRHPSPGEPPDRIRLRHACGEFEAILLASWWKSAAPGFSGLTDEEKGEGGFLAFREFAMEAMSLAMARSGGMGVGDLVYRRLSLALPSRNE